MERLRNLKVIDKIRQKTQSIIYFTFLLFFYKLNKIIKVSNLTFSICSIWFERAYNFDQFVNHKIPVTSEFARYFMERNPKFLMKNYKKLTPNPNPVEYHTILPFHEDGTSKREIKYLDYFLDKNVIIKHFTSYLNHSDKFENSTEISRILPNEEKTPEISFKKFTLIYLIIVSSPKTNIIREIKAMSNEKVAFILFIDNKSNRTNIYKLFSNVKKNITFKNVYFVDSPRFRIGWSKITLSLSEAVLMKAAIKYFPNSLYLSLHSESDYPLIPNKLILKYLSYHYPENFIALNNLDQIKDWKLQRPEIFHFSVKKNDKIMKMIRFLFPNRKLLPITWQFGSNWFTMTIKDSVKIINELVKKPIFIDYLEYAFVSDENLFQTVLFESNVSTTKDTHRYIDWSTTDGHPRTFEVQHFKKLIQNKCFFWARKFAANRTELFDLIDSHRAKMENSMNYSVKLCK